MPTFAILSRDAHDYRNALQSRLAAHWHLAFASSTPDPELPWADVEVLLAAPDLAARVVADIPSLKWVQSTWAGVTPLIQQPRRNFTLTGLSDVFGAQMREYVLTYLLYFSRQVELTLALQKKHLWQPPQPQHLSGKTLGVVGIGDIGSEVARAAKHFGMRVLGLSRTARSNPHLDAQYSITQWKAFAERLDFLVVLLPHTPDTENLLDEHRLAMLPAHCILINAGRGQTLDTRAVIDMLKSKQLRAAVLDVFEQEPLVPSDPLWDCPNLIITQHTAALSEPDKVAEFFMLNTRRYEQGLSLEKEIDMTLGY